MISITGISAIEEALLAELEKLQQEATEVVNDAVMACTQRSIDYCPVETGRLAHAITSSPAEGEIEITGACGIPDGVVNYAWYVHMGHFTRNHHSYVPAQPFIARAFFEIQPTFFAEMESIDL